MLDTFKASWQGSRGGGGVRSRAVPRGEEVGEGPGWSPWRQVVGTGLRALGASDVRAAIQNRGRQGGCQVGSQQRGGGG
jgi:hypothetical protein